MAKMENQINNVLDLFKQISAIPRCSKNEDKISSWIVQWAVSNGFNYGKDNFGNLLVTVPPSGGYENDPGIILQTHMDMVCEKTPESGVDTTS